MLNIDWEFRLPGMRHNSGCASVCLSFDGSVCGAVDRYGVCRLWRLVKWRWCWEQDIESPPVSAATILDTEQGRVFVLGHHNGCLSVVNEADRQCLWLQSVHKNAVSGVVVLPKLESIVTWSHDGTVCSISLYDGRVLWRQPVLPSAIDAREQLVCGHSGGISVLDAQDGHVLQEFDSDGTIHHAVIHGPHHILFISDDEPSRGGQLHRLNMLTGEVRHLADGATTLALLGTGDCLIGLQSGGIAAVQGNTFELLSNWRPHFDRINGIGVSGTGCFATCSRDAGIGVWADVTGRTFGEPEGGTIWHGPVVGLERRHEVLVVGFTDGTIMDVHHDSGRVSGQTGTLGSLSRLACTHDKTAAITPNGDLLLIQGSESAVMETGLEVPEVLICTDQVVCAINHSGVLAAVAREEAQRIRNIDTGICDPASMAWLPAAKLLAVGREDSAHIDFVRLSFDTERAEIVRSARLPRDVVCPVTQLFSFPDGSLMAVAGSAGYYHVVRFNSFRSRPVVWAVIAIEDGDCYAVDIDSESGLMAIGVERDVCVIRNDSKGDEPPTFVLCDESLADYVVNSHAGIVLGLRIIDGSAVASVGEDGFIRRVNITMD